VTSSIICAGPLEGTTLLARYSASILSSGDVWSSAAVFGGAFEIGASAFFSSSQVGATTAPVQFTYDVAGTFNGGWWMLSLNRPTAVVTVEYNDADVTNGKQTWAWVPAKCIVNNY
jgi:hypothetical protein